MRIYKVDGTKNNPVEQKQPRPHQHQHQHQDFLIISLEVIKRPNLLLCLLLCLRKANLNLY